MKSGKSRQEDEEEDEDEFGGRRDATQSANKDGKGNDRVNAMRSKHSVTEQRRRSKINERYKVLRELIPHSDQKRDTASFLLEVINYVQLLQEKVQKYEGPYQTWSSSEPTKLVPWRNSHWRVQSFSSQPQTIKNVAGPGSAFPGQFDQNTVAAPMTMQTVEQHPMEPGLPFGPMEPEVEHADKATVIPLHLQETIPVSLGNDVSFSHTLHGAPPDAQPAACPSTSDALDHQDDTTIEGGTISVSSVYSQGLLNALTQALQATGLDLSRAAISVQINLGKRDDRSSIQGLSSDKDHGAPMTSTSQPGRTFNEANNTEDFDRAHKRRKN